MLRCADGVNKKSHEIFSAVTHHLNCEMSFRNLLTEPHAYFTLKNIESPSFSGILFSCPNIQLVNRESASVNLKNYLSSRIILEALTAWFLIIWFLLRGIPEIMKHEVVHCQIEKTNYFYRCDGHPQVQCLQKVFTLFYSVWSITILK